MLASVLLILGLGFLGGQIARRSGLPPLFAMIIVGIFLQSLIDPAVIAAARDLRIVAVCIILMKAGLGLDAEKLVQQGTVALRLGFLPATLEAIVVGIIAVALFQFDWLNGLLLGCIIGAESPAVIVPGMLRLKSLGWGVEKGIPDAILTGSALSDVLLLLVFNLLLGILTRSDQGNLVLPGGITLTSWQVLPIQVIGQIGLGIGLGYIVARMVVFLLSRQRWAENVVQETIVTFCFALGLVIAAEKFPFYSGYLAVMALGFFLIELDRPLARTIRSGFDSLWTVAEIFLFVFLGTAIDLSILGKVFLSGIVLLLVSTLVGRGLGWWLSTQGSNWNWRERLFLLPANSAKATVQAALGAIPLSYGIRGGDTMLALAALSILVTAPLGAWAIPTFAPRLLQKGEVDPTKVAVNRKVTFLCAVDLSEVTPIVLAKTAELARRADGRVIVLHVPQEGTNYEAILTPWLESNLGDIRYQLITPYGVVPEVILRTAQEYGVDEIIMGKGQHSALVGSVSQAVLEASPIPVIVVTLPDPTPVTSPTT
ncbi:MAG: cation:proton antiporter [Pseudanabaenaceae cyanobacterium SKYGB_i_bin29]|nr:cation:proton antiporter [Pseudanabaenaceae cyanobacterium SKYG29]MDW8422138.1 cation:proton antiporter [Pseudanabaenaceae cyanobacterium SKYGB_i_bin29]